MRPDSSPELPKIEGLTDQYREPEVLSQLNRPLIRSWIICFEPDYNITIIWNRDRCSLDWIFEIQINFITVPLD